MGFWGSGLYDNDFTNDVKDTYLHFLQEGHSCESAYKKTINVFTDCIGSEDEPLLWYAIADTQWRLGQLMIEAKRNALAHLENNGGLSFWKENLHGSCGWKKTILHLKRRLNKPQPRKAEHDHPADYQYNPGFVGDVFAYQLHSKVAKKAGVYGKYAVFQKIGTKKNGYDYLCPHVIFFDMLFDEIPTVLDLDAIRILPFDPPERFMPSGRNTVFPMLNMSAVLDLSKKENSPEKFISCVGSYPIVQGLFNQVDHRAEFGWDDIEETLLYYYFEWKNYSYELCDFGSFVSLKEYLV